MRSRVRSSTKALATLLVFLALLVGRLFIWPYDSTSVSHKDVLFPTGAPPSWAHPMGTTSLGQDVFVRVFDGAGSALAVMAVGTFASVIFALLLALLSYIGGKLFDKIIVTISDALYALPSILIALALLIGIPTDFSNRYWLVIAAAAAGVTLFFGTKIFRTVRANLISAQQQGYFTAAIALDVPKPTIFFRHLLPNSLGGIRPLLTGAGSDSILTLAGLGFIGVGISATDGADWGYDLSRGIGELIIGNWWSAFFPALAISISVFAFSRIPEGRSQNA